MTTRKQLIRAGVIAKHDATCAPTCHDDVSTYEGWDEVERILKAVLPLVADGVEVQLLREETWLVDAAWNNAISSAAHRVRLYVEPRP